MNVHRQKTAGFTLVELAVVMMIVGLLIGGILKGSELMRNAALTATIAQVESYRAAVTTFRDVYSYLPGDYPFGQTRLAGCTAACGLDVWNGGNGYVGDMQWGQWFHTFDDTSLPNQNQPSHKERGLFWMHLLFADLITGVTPEGLTATSYRMGVTHPASKSGRGGFCVGYDRGTLAQTGSPATGNFPSGHFILLASDLFGVSAFGVLTAKDASLIDRKMDDGKPASGIVQAIGDTASCFTSGALLQYNEVSSGYNCGLLFKIF